MIPFSPSSEEKRHMTSEPDNRCNKSDETPLPRVVLRLPVAPSFTRNRKNKQEESEQIYKKSDE